MVQWFEAPADMIINAAGYNTNAVEVSGSGAELKLVTLAWTKEQILANGEEPAYWGYYEATDNSYNSITAFEDNADRTGDWVDIESSGEGSPFGPDLWSNSGVGVPVTPEPTDAINEWDWVEMMTLGEKPTVKRGDIIGVAMKNTSTKMDEERISFLATNTLGIPGFKFYTNGRLVSGGPGVGDPGWWSRKYTWDFALDVTITGDAPPSYENVTHFESTFSTDERIVSATITDTNPSGGVTGVASVSLFYSVDAGSSWSEVSMKNSGDLYSAYIPGQTGGSTVDYYLSATDVQGLTNKYPNNNYLTYEVFNSEFFENFEGNWTQDWYVSNGTWEVGKPTSGPNGTYTGQNCAATVLTGNYSENVESRLIKINTFKVPSADQNPHLRFWHWYSFGEADTGKVQIKVDGGNWQTISENYTKNSSGIWSYPIIDLTPFAGKNIQIGFHFKSVFTGWHGSSDKGWYIDDLVVKTGAFNYDNPESFENGVVDWDVDYGVWEIGEPTSGPGSAYTGNNCAATVLNGNYGESLESRLVSAPTIVPSADQNPHLRFWHWYSFGEADTGKVQIKVDGGNWQTISENYTKNSSGIWSYPIIDLTPFAGKNIQIGFHFKSVFTGWHGSSDKGWYVDDLVVKTGAFNYDNPESFENGVVDWDVDYGIWEVGKPTSGPGSAYTGNNCAATVLNGNYGESLESKLISAPIVIPKTANNIALRFWHWYSFGEADTGRVQIKVDDGNWQNLAGTFSGTSSSAWTNYYIPMNDYKVHTIQIGFHFKSVFTGWHGSSDKGWYIDDIFIEGISEPIWPGDTENDRDVDQADILPIGFNWGAVGNKRSTISLDWSKQYCQPWDSVSNTYVDCNGDGTINEADVLAVGLNWGKTHTSLSANRDNNIIANQNYSGKIRLSEIEHGSEDITLGLEFDATEGSPNLRGLSFKLTYGKGIESVAIEEGAYLGTELLSFQHIENDKSSLGYAIVSKVSNNVDSKTSVAKIKIQFKDGYTAENIEITEVEGINANGEKIFAEGIASKIDLVTGIEENSVTVKEFRLHQNYPNPFNPTTTIAYSIPQDSHVKLSVYNILGEEVATLVNGNKSAGTYNLQFNASKLTSGVYIYRITTDKNSDVKKLILMK